MNSKEVKVIAKSGWKPAQGGMVKCRVVIWEMDDRTGPEFSEKGKPAKYASHMECDLENGSATYFHDGHYCLTMGEALLDFEARCRANLIPPYPVVEDDFVFSV